MRFDKKDSKIPNGTTIIGEGVFENFTSLRAIDVPDGVEIIEKDAFFGCCDEDDVREMLVAIEIINVR